METKPTHEQAQLHLQVYEMRREPKLRQARDWFFKNYIVESLDDAMRLAAPGTETGAYVGMVLGYWEQACALLNSGLLNDDLFFKTSGEFFGIWERCKAIAPEARKKFAYPPYLEELEKAALRYESWAKKHAPGHIEAMREMMKNMQSQLKKAAA